LPRVAICHQNHTGNNPKKKTTETRNIFGFVFGQFQPQECQKKCTCRNPKKKTPIESTEPGDPFVFFFVPFQPKDFVEHADFDTYHKGLFKGRGGDTGTCASIVDSACPL